MFQYLNDNSVTIAAVRSLCGADNQINQMVTLRLFDSLFYSSPWQGKIAFLTLLSVFLIPFLMNE